MTRIQKLFIVPIFTLLSIFALMAMPMRTSAQSHDQASCEKAGGAWTHLSGAVFHCVCPDGKPISSGNCPGGGAATVKNDCNNDSNNNNSTIDQKDCGITRYIVLIINVMSAIVGVVVVFSIILGGIQYTMAGSDPQKVTEAKNRIRNAIIALLFFIFGYAFLNYLIPGGVLG